MRLLISQFVSIYERVIPVALTSLRRRSASLQEEVLLHHSGTSQKDPASIGASVGREEEVGAGCRNVTGSGKEEKCGDHIGSDYGHGELGYANTHSGYFWERSYINSWRTE